MMTDPSSVEQELIKSLVYMVHTSYNPTVMEP